MTASELVRKTMKRAIRPFAVTLLDIGIDPRRVASLRHLSKYASQYHQFKSLGGKATHTFPVLSNYDEQAGSASGHYFHQDLLVASFVHRRNPSRHIDIGSRIDGFVAHVAAFRKIEVVDVRDLDSTEHQNIAFIKANMMDRDNVQENISDSISCLHAIEHFGLGRYGDPIDPQGHLKGFNNICQMLRVGGILYISFPIGRSNEVHFNAHRIFHPKDILSWAEDRGSIMLERFDYVDDAGDLHQDAELATANLDLSFGCGIYTLKKLR